MLEGLKQPKYFDLSGKLESTLRIESAEQVFGAYTY